MWLNQANPQMKGKKIIGSWKALIILIDFPDYRWDHQADTNFVNDSLYYTTNHYDSLANSLGTFRHPGCVSNVTGSIRDFYIENSYGLFDVVSATTIWYTAPDTFNYYCNTDGIAGTDDDYGFGYYPNNAQKLVEDAVAAADPGVDFSQYDNDLDGYVDALYVVHAGPGAEALSYPTRANYIWSHAWGIDTQTRDGVNISSYSMEPEDGKVGVFCHEFGHVIGLPDLYDYTYLSSGVGEWCAMAGGSWGHRDSADLRGTAPTHFSAWCKQELGWVNPVNLTHNLLGQTIPPAELSPVVYRLWDDGDSTSSQYFLVENRQNIGFDSGLTRRQLDYGLPRGHGLLIWHVDELVYGNDDRTHKMVDLEESSPVNINGFYLEHLDTVRTLPLDKYLYNGNRGDDGDPWPGYWLTDSDSVHYSGSRDKCDFNQFSVPSSKNYAGANTLAGAENITENGVNITADLFVTIDASVAFPGLGDTLDQADSVNIIWRSSAAGGVACDSLYFSSDSGSAWSLIGFANSGDTLYPWTAPAISSGRCFIRVVTITNAGIKANHLSDMFAIGLTGVAGNTNENLKDLKYRLLPARPNPALGGIITVSFEIPKPQKIELRVYNIVGQTVKVLAGGFFQAGRHEIKWDGRNEKGMKSAPGIYLYQLKTPDFSKINKLVIVK
ncbi:M6 family metalloprotease domain-containing protein [candidate division TA06 bacterium]|uniref:M6 family metalloprotease domain-containing protein n=1 Tax=candidate division TA06 bacterium TaxID=2250710 RepID=A0A933MIU9_UNCT6|nr:M6 family metalloprotease domain-containing protein [candidate division TA06 bacterium]